MSPIRVSTIVDGDMENVYAALKKVERFQEFMPPIRNVKVLWCLPPNRQISDWEVEVEGVIVHWKQEDTYDDERHSIFFRTLEGDNVSTGRWTVEKSQPSRAKVTIEATYDWGIPKLGKHVGPALDRLAKAHLIKMVAALRKHLRHRKQFARG